MLHSKMRNQSMQDTTQQHSTNLLTVKLIGSITPQ